METVFKYFEVEGRALAGRPKKTLSKVLKMDLETRNMLPIAIQLGKLSSGEQN